LSDGLLACADKILKTNRDHWCIENCCHYIIDWNFDEDRSRIRTGNGPENVSRLRRFAVGLIKSKGVPNRAQKMRQLSMSVRAVFDFLRKTKKFCGAMRRLALEQICREAFLVCSLQPAYTSWMTQNRFISDPAIPWVEIRQTTESRESYKEHSHSELSVGAVTRGTTLMRMNGQEHPVLFWFSVNWRIPTFELGYTNGGIHHAKKAA